MHSYALLCSQVTRRAALDYVSVCSHVREAWLSGAYPTQPKGKASTEASTQIPPLLLELHRLAVSGKHKSSPRALLSQPAAPRLNRVSEQHGDLHRFDICFARAVTAGPGCWSHTPTNPLPLPQTHSHSHKSSPTPTNPLPLPQTHSHTHKSTPTPINPLPLP